MEKRIDQAADVILNSKLTLALTGAGISVDSGIPDFRSPGGLWSIYDPGEYATISAFIASPEKVWEMAREMTKLIDQSAPNSAHNGMAELERMGFLHHIITQNVDNLHQEAGSKNVIEYHGNVSTLTCLKCGRNFKRSEINDIFPPRCTCRTKQILKPDVVFFGEEIPTGAMEKSFLLASQATALIVVGTSALVSPANTIPSISKRNNSKIIEINKESTHLTGTITDIFLQGDAGMIISGLVEALRAKVG